MGQKKVLGLRHPANFLFLLFLLLGQFLFCHVVIFDLPHYAVYDTASATCRPLIILSSFNFLFICDFVPLQRRLFIEMLQIFMDCLVFFFRMKPVIFNNLAIYTFLLFQLCLTVFEYKSCIKYFAHSCLYFKVNCHSL